MSERTLRRWRHGQGGPLGRPQTEEDERRRAFRIVVTVCRRFRWHAGWRRVAGELEGELSVRLIQECVRRAKLLHARHEERHLRAHRVHVEVLATNVVWHHDATHLGRMPDGEEVQGDVVRDGAASDVLAASVGGTLSSADAIRSLEAAIECAGAAPLVESTDNGAPYTSAEYKACLKRHRIVHMKNLPRTPQHNARAERIIREVKAEAGLAPGVVFTRISEAEACLAAACQQLEARANTSRSTPLAPVRYTPQQRDAFYKAVRRRVRDALLCAEGARARRRAEREAIHAELEERGLIRRTRGGVPSARQKADTLS
ncbi:MAG: hypothetical protein HMLKMBBP_01116 [Planctomycetes bacterium]|nr:hypothetical protein [Planctomycetota bacterium]